MIAYYQDHGPSPRGGHWVSQHLLEPLQDAGTGQGSKKAKERHTGRASAAKFLFYFEQWLSQGGEALESGIVLCVDDDSTVLNALRSVLSSNFGSEMEFEFAESGEEAMEIDAEIRSQGRELGLVISDFMMPGLRGDELLVRLHANSPNTIKILLTGQSDMTGVKRAINDANLYRFLEKPFLNEDIVLTVRAAIRAYHQERDLIRQNEQLRQMNAELEVLVQARTLELVEKNRELEVLSVTDRLTGLANRRKLDEVLEEELIRARRYGVEFSVALMDIDHFKRVNDTLGHAAGDLVLEVVARILRQCTRDADLVARMGGEEFVVVCRHTDMQRCALVAEKVRAAIESHDFSGIGRVTASFGVAVFDKDDSVASLMARADAAAYRAKGAGRNRVETSDEP